MDAAAPDLGHSPFLYDLIFYGPAIPDPPAWRVTPADHARLARVVNHFKTMNDAADYQELRFGFAPLQEFGVLSPEPVFAPRARVEYLSPDPVRWGQEVFRFSPPNGEVDVDLYELPYAPYDAGERQDRTWYGAPFRPDFGAQRDLTTMWAGFDDLHDSDGHSGFLSGWSDTADRPSASGCSATASSWSTCRRRTSTRSRSARPRPATGWSATSTPPRCCRSPARPAASGSSPPPAAASPRTSRTCRCWRSTTAPPRWAAATAPWPASRSPSTWTCTAEGAPASEAVVTSLSFSTDGGTKWIRVALTQLGPGRYRAVLPGGAMVAGRTVGLRASARDADGGRLEQTLLRAFPVR